MENRNSIQRDKEEQKDFCIIIALTAYTDLETQQQCKQAGIKEIIQKPLVSEVLAAIMEKYFLVKKENWRNN